MWWVLEAPEWGEQFISSGLGASGGEVLGRRVEASEPQRLDSRGPEAGLSRPPPLREVLGGQARHEEEVMTKHFPSLRPVGGPGQVWPHWCPSVLSVKTQVLF